MKRLENGMLLYHGSYAEVKNIDLSRCRAGRDFGKGFYLTSSYEQAEAFLGISLRNAKKENLVDESACRGFVSVFEYNEVSALNVKYFDDADRAWLHFVASNRRGNLFADEKAEYARCDIICGKIANDRTSATLQLYTAGGYGVPGGDAADSTAISLLLPNRLDDQYCFLTESAIRNLTFIRSEAYDV